MPKFWTGGSENYTKALRERYNADRTQLQARLEHCADPDQRRA